MKNTISIFILVLVVFSSCVVRKPDSYLISDADYNTRRNVRSANYTKRLSGFGIAVTVSATAAGAYIGSQSKIINYYDGDKRKYAPPADAAIGAVIGLTTTYLINYALGLNKKIPIDDPNIWLKKTNKDYLYLHGGNNSFDVIHKSAHDKYQVKNFQDITDFTKAFPQSQKTNDIFWMGGQILERKLLPDLITKKPDNPFNTQIKYRYLKLSSTSLDCIEAKNRYFELNDSAELCAILKIASIQDVYEIDKNWPVSNYPELLGKKYFNVASTTEQFIEVAKKYAFLNDDCEKKAVEYLTSYNDIVKHYNMWNKSKVAVELEKKAILICDRPQLEKFINFYPKQNTKNAKIHFIATAPDYSQLIEATNKYNNILYVPDSLDYNNLTSIKKHFNNLVNNKNFFTENQFIILKNSLIDTYLANAFQNAKTSLFSLLELKEILKNEAWLNASQSENNTKDYLSLVNNQILDYYRIMEFHKIKESGSIEEKMDFCMRYPSTMEANTFQEELSNFVNRVVKITDVDYWTAKGDASWLNDLAETSRDFIHGGQNYNVFVIGKLENFSESPVKVTLTIDLMRYKTCGVSILQSTSVEKSTDHNNLIIPPGYAVPFLCVFKNLSEGTTVGSGLISAGCRYRWADEPVKATKSFYNGAISNQQMTEHLAWVRDVVNKGNVHRELSPNEKVDQWISEKFGIEANEKTTLRINSSISENLTIYGIDCNGVKIIENSVEIDGYDFEDFKVDPQNNYLVSTSAGTFKVFAKGRMTHLIIKDNESRVDYDDVD